MIKVGDKLLIKDEVYVIQNESYNDNKVEAKCTSEFKFVEMEFDTALGYAFAYEKQRADAAEAKWERLKQYVDENITESDREYQSTHDLTYDGASAAYEDVYYLMLKLERGEE